MAKAESLQLDPEAVEMNEAAAKLTQYVFENTITIGNVSEKVFAKYVSNKDVETFDPNAPLIVTIGGGNTGKDGMVPTIHALSEISGLEANILGVPHISHPNVTTENPKAKERLSKAAQNELTTPYVSADNLVAAKLICDLISSVGKGNGPIVIVGLSNGCLVGLDAIAQRNLNISLRLKAEKEKLDALPEDRRDLTKKTIEELETELHREIRFVGFNPAGTYDNTSGISEPPTENEITLEERRLVLKKSLIRAASYAIPRVYKIIRNFPFNASRNRPPYSVIAKYEFLKNPKPEEGREDDDRNAHLSDGFRLLMISALDSVSAKIEQINSFYVGDNPCTFYFRFGKDDTVFPRKYFDLTANNLRIEEIEGRHEEILLKSGGKVAAGIVAEIAQGKTRRQVGAILEEVGLA